MRKGQGKSDVSEYQLDLDDATGLALVIATIRGSGQISRPKVVRQTGFSRTLATKHIDIALGSGILYEGELGISTGGRAPRLLEFNPSAGTLLIAELGASGLSVAISDLSGNLSQIQRFNTEISLGPDHVLAQVESAFDAISAECKIKNIWGIGIGLPGPVEFAAGIPMSPPIMPGWDRYPVRKRFADKYDAPVWVDNDVNLMALGEHVTFPEKKSNELIYIKIGSGIGAGILTHGRLHRGAQGCAGDIGHIAISEKTHVICRCGNVGCLESVVGGIALARDALEAIADGKSKFLTLRKKNNKIINARDVIDGAKSGDKWCVDAINNVGNQVGRILAMLVNFHNPALIVIGGGVSAAGDPLLASIRETVFRRSLPLATRDLEIRLGVTDDSVGLKGAAEMVISELFEPEFLKQWINSGRPTGSHSHLN
jgi:glucokinase-like ROK family protein